MPRNQDGSFTRFNNRDYQYDDTKEVNAVINGKILNDDIEDLRAGIEDCIDGKGRGKVDRDINWGGNRITDLGDTQVPNHILNFGRLLNHVGNGYVLADNGSDEAKAEVNLIIDLDIKFAKGYIFEFVAPFTQSEKNLRELKHREVFILKSLTDEITLPVLRDKFDPNDNLGRKTDLKPSFEKGYRYKYVIDEYKGELYVRWKDPYELPTTQILLGNFSADRYPDKYKDIKITPAGFFLCEVYHYWDKNTPLSLSSSFMGALRNLLIKKNDFSLSWLQDYWYMPRVFIRY